MRLGRSSAPACSWASRTRLWTRGLEGRRRSTWRRCASSTCVLSVFPVALHSFRSTLSLVIVSPMVTTGSLADDAFVSQIYFHSQSSVCRRLLLHSFIHSFIHSFHPLTRHLADGDDGWFSNFPSLCVYSSSSRSFVMGCFCKRRWAGLRLFLQRLNSSSCIRLRPTRTCTTHIHTRARTHAGVHTRTRMPMYKPHTHNTHALTQ